MKKTLFTVRLWFLGKSDAPVLKAEESSLNVCFLFFKNMFFLTVLFTFCGNCGCVILGQLQWFSARWRRTQAWSPRLVYFEKEGIPLRSATLQIAPGFFEHWNAGVCRLGSMADV